MDAPRRGRRIRLGNEYDKAFADLTKVLELRPKAVRSQVNLGVLYLQKMHAMAVIQLTKALNVSNTGSGSGGFDALESSRTGAVGGSGGNSNSNNNNNNDGKAALPLSTG